MYPTMSYNQAQHGIELSFPGIPTKDTREQMKANGFRYHREKNIWYAKQTDERDRFARGLCGEKAIAKEAPSQEETLYRYYSRRPVDLGTYPKKDGSPVNIVNFDSRVPVEDGKLTAWGYVEYAKPLSRKDADDYELTPAKDYEASEKTVPEKKKPEKTAAVSAEQAPPANTFAACYDKIGDAPILKDGDFSLYEHHEAFIHDQNISFRSLGGGDALYITELENAGKNGKSCAEYSIYLRNRNTSDSITCHLMNACNIQTVAQLYEAIKSGKDLGFEVYVDKREQKGVETFSPFAETKPLKKIPDRWNKRNFANAMLSGQIYAGRVDQVLTDDYLYDAATNFREGTPIYMPGAARNAVEDWSSLASVHSSDIKPDGTCKLDYYNGYSTSKTFFFDLNCNIAEGKRRAEERQEGIRRHNEMLVRSCIQVSPESIDPGKIYTLTTIETGTNSGIYGVEKENLQGHVLQERLDPEHLYMQVLGVEEMQIQPEKLYSVANFHHRRSEHGEKDNRIIDCGNWQNIVTGKALLELTAEGVYFPDIREGYGEYKDFETAKQTLSRFINGTMRFMFSGEKTDYKSSLASLESEYARATAKPSLELLMRSAESRVQSNSAPEKTAPQLQR